MATHPANAVFVSGDGKVSFNENGRKLDSNGNVVWGDRQSLRGARARVRPEIVQAYEEEERQRQAQAQQAPPVQEYRPPGGMMGQGDGQQQPPPVQGNPWEGVASWGAPMEGQNWRQYAPPQRPQPAPTLASAPPPSGMGGQPTASWNQFRPQQPPQQQQPQQQTYLPMVQSWNRFRR